jgi:GT2 family glycosyltransferase/glycosyltransferase involved in cell wall biosynthesis
VRIVLIVHGFPPAASGGTENYADACARELRRAGDDVLVVTREQDPGHDEYAVRAEDRDGIRIVRINNTFRNKRSFEETYRDDAIEAAMVRAIDEFRPDAAHVHHLTGLSTTIVTRLRERGIPIVATLHDYWLMCHRGQLLDVELRACAGPDACRRCVGVAGGAGPVTYAGAQALRAVEKRLPLAAAQSIRSAAERMAAMVSTAGEADEQHCRRLDHMRAICRDVTRFIAPSQSIRERFMRFGVHADRIELSRYGVDAAAFRGLTRTKSDRLRIGFIGSLMVSKAPHVLLEAVRELPRGSFSVDVYGGYAPYHGDDRYRWTLEPLLQQDGVSVRGPVPRERVPLALASLDVLVVPSIWPENSPFVIHEAFLAGVPVIASRIGGIPELVDGGRGGLLFDPGDATSLARVLGRVVNEPRLLASLRDTIPPVRAIEDDVAAARRLYTIAPERVPDRRIAAVVLNYGTPDDTYLAVRSLLASQPPLSAVIVVNNGTADDLLQAALEPVLPRIVLIHNGRNLGFPGGMNVGIRAALERGADAVMLVNSDVVMPPDSVAALDRALASSPRAGIAGPVVLSRSEPDRIASLGMTYGLTSGRMRDRAGATGRTGPTGRTGGMVDAVSGCAMLVGREVFDAIGLFDEDYFFGFEDLDFCLRGRAAGFTTILAGAAAAYHEGGRSIGATSSRRLYFAARNHLRLARRADPGAHRIVAAGRAASIVMLNLAHAVRARGGSIGSRLAAVVRGTRDYMANRFGPGSD